MKVLIAYTSKTGTVTDCICRLEKDLRGLEIDKKDLSKENPNPSSYDIVIVGCPIRFGKLSKATRTYLKKYEKEIVAKPHALFLCCGFAHEYEYYVESLFSDNLRASAFSIMNFGGTLDYKGQNFFEKMLIHAARSSIRESEIEDGEYTPELPGILPENIGKMATYVRFEVAKLTKI